MGVLICLIIFAVQLMLIRTQTDKSLIELLPGQEYNLTCALNITVCKIENPYLHCAPRVFTFPQPGEVGHWFSFMDSVKNSSVFHYDTLSAHLDNSRKVISLTIKASVVNEGRYVCSQGEKDNPKQDNPMLTMFDRHVKIIIPPDSMQIRHGTKVNPMEVKARENSNLVLQCIVGGGRPEPYEIFWERDAKRLPAAYSINTSSPDPNNSSLTETTLTLSYNVTEFDRKNPNDMFTCRFRHRAMDMGSQLIEPKKDVIVMFQYAPKTVRISGTDHTSPLHAGQRMRLRCETEANPGARVKWLKSGHVFDTSEDKEQSSHTYFNEYDFILTEKDDNTEYTCEAENALSQSPIIKSVKLTVYYPPASVTVTQQDGTFIMSNGNAVFQCQSAPSHPVAQIHWYIDGRSVRADRNYDGGSTESRGITATSTVTVNAEKFGLGSNGARSLKVECKATNNNIPSNDASRVVEQSIDVAVYSPPSSLQVESSIEPDVMLRVGDKLQLSCIAIGGNPPPDITWSRGHTQFERTDDNDSSDEMEKVRIYASAGKTTAVVTTLVQRSDNGGGFKCSSTTKYIHQTKPLTKTLVFSVEFHPARVDIVPTKTIFRSSQKEGLLTCEATTANPPPKLAWFRNGRPVNDKSIVRGAISANFNGKIVTSRYTMKLTPSENGVNYTCKAQHKAYGVSPEAHYVAKIWYAPFFTPDDKRVEMIVENEQLEVRLPYKSNPKIRSFVWYRNGVEVSDGKQYGSSIILKNNVITSTGVTPNDSATYKLRISNNEGEDATIEVEINVKFAPTIRFVEKKKYVDVGSDIRLKCSVDSYPVAKVDWIRTDGKGMDLYKMISDDNDHYLEIDQVNYNDTGRFLCLAENEMGIEEMEIMLFINQPAIVKNVREFAFATPDEVDGELVASLVCIVSGVPEPHIDWLKSDKNLDVSSKYETRIEPFGLVEWKSVLTIHNVDASDYGDKYTCVAINSASSGSQSHSTNPVELKKEKSRPMIPFDMQMLNRSSDSVMFEWKPNFNGGHDQFFEIQYSDSDNKRGAVQVRNGTVAMVEGLKPGTEYIFRIRALNSRGQSEYSQGIPVSTLGRAPSHMTESDFLRLIFICVAVVIVVLVLNICLLVFCRKMRREKMITAKQKSAKKQPKAEMNGKVVLNGVLGETEKEEKATATRMPAQNKQVPYYDQMDTYHQSSTLQSSNGHMISFKPEQRMPLMSTTNPQQTDESSISPDHMDSQTVGYGEVSDDEVSSLRTVIEVDSNGRPYDRHNNNFFQRGHSFSGSQRQMGSHHGSNADSLHNTALYSDPYKNNSLQRKLISGQGGGGTGPGMYQPFAQQQTGSGHLIGPHGDSVVLTDGQIPPLGPLRSISEHLNQYTPHYTPSLGGRGSLRKYPPPPSEMGGVHTVAQLSDKQLSNYVEVRQLNLPNHNHAYSNGGSGGSNLYVNNALSPVSEHSSHYNGSPILSTFSPSSMHQQQRQQQQQQQQHIQNSQGPHMAEPVDYDLIKGDLV